MKKRNRYIETKQKYRVFIEKSLIVALLIFTCIFYLSPKFERDYQLPSIVDLAISIENIPVTRQQKKGIPPPPPRPAVPIAVEEEEISEDVTIEPTEISLINIPLPPAPTFGYVGDIRFRPRIIKQVFPRFPDEEKNKGTSGIVLLRVKVDENGKVVNHEVLQNTTGSKICVEEAIKAAYKTEFIPANNGINNIAIWTELPYRYGQ